MAIIAAPPARRTIREFVIVRVVLAPGPELEAVVEARDSNGDSIIRHEVEVRPASARGIRYTAAGGIESFAIENPAHAATDPAAAFAAFSGAAGGFNAKAAALETWLQGVGLLPS